MLDLAQLHQQSSEPTDDSRLMHVTLLQALQVTGIKPQLKYKVTVLRSYLGPSTSELGATTSMGETASPPKLPFFPYYKSH